MKKRKTRELLIEEATKLFYERGCGNASIRDIVSAAGVTNTAVYNHFKNKDHLIFVVIDKIGTDFLKVIEEAQAKHDHPLDRLKEMIYQHIRIGRERNMEFKIYLEEEYHLKPEYRKIILDQHRIIYDAYMSNLVELEKMGLLRPINKVIANFNIIAAINWSYRWLKTGGGLSIEEIADGLIDIVIGGILEPEAYTKLK